MFDGLALGVGYRQGAGLEATTLIAVLAHKIPEGMALMSLLLHGGFASRRAVRYAWMVAGITPLAAVLSFGVLGDWLRPVHMGVMLACVAGSFIYISASDLLPEIRRNPRLRDSAFIVAGVALVWVMTTFAHGTG